MRELQLQFFGGLRLTLGDRDVTRRLSVKARGLICYLAITGRPQTRLKLAGMFWGEKPEADALRSLRVDLTKIRKALAPYIEANRQTIAFKNSSSHWIDTETFEHHLRLVQNSDGAAARTHLREAVQLYSGDFLEGYEAGDAYDFEEWLAAQRESYRSQMLAALDKLIEIDTEFGEYEAAVAYAQHILRIDPWREETHRSLMWLYVQNGQRGAALRQFEICRSVLADELGVAPEQATLQLWQQIKEQEGTVTAVTQPIPLPQTAPISEIPFQAPQTVPFFSGRDAELAQLKTKVEAGEGVQVLCLAGMGGVGKTSLAVQFAHQYRECFQDGVLWADAASDPATVAERWAVAFGYDFRGIGQVEDRLVALRTMLAEKQALIVVDGVEVAARVKPLLPEAGASTVLLTMRNAELAYTLGAELLNLDVLTMENGRSLLAGIIGINRVEAEQGVADEICHTLQNLPLALAIAGQYLVARPRRRLSEFLQRLKASKLLDVADSEGAVRASFAISWTALDQMQQRVFALLAVFAGRAFTAEAMAYIAEQDFWVMQDHLDTLSARSLLIEQGSDYYRQHTLLAHFADEKLVDKHNQSLRLVAYYSGYTDKYSTDYQKLTGEWDNLDAAIQLIAQEQLWHTLFHINQNLHQAWFAQGLFARAQQAYQLAYEGALLIEDDEQIGENLYKQGMAILEQGRFDKARDFLEQALSIFEELKDVVSVSEIEYQLARIHIFQGRYAIADDLLARSLQVRESLMDWSGIAQVKYRQALLKYYVAKHKQALLIALKAMEIQQQINDTLDLVRTLRLLVMIYCELEDYDAAQSNGNKAFSLAKELEDQGEVAWSLYGLAHINRLKKQFELALSQAQKSLTLLEKMGDIASQGNVALQICLIYRDMQNYVPCLQYAQKALELYERVSDRLGVAWALGNTGNAYFGLGEPALAKENWLASRQIAKELKNEFWISRIDGWMAQS